MNHEERLALIYKPFFIERFSTNYPWSGRQTGRTDWHNQLLDNYVVIKGKRHYFSINWRGLRLNVAQ